jgi:modulator of FtsH protease HflK
MDRKERTVFITVIVSGLVILLKFWLAAASGSLALRASAVHSVADAAIGVFVLLGLLFGRWAASRGATVATLARLESWVALGVALAIFFVGFDIVREVILAEPADLRNLGPVALAALITVPVALFLARYLQYVGRQTQSPALIASGYHAQMDIWSSVVAVAGLGGAALGIPTLDRAAAAVVVVFVLFAGYEIITSAWRSITTRTALDVDHVNATHGHAGSRGGPGRSFLSAAVGILIAIYLFSGLYLVQPGEAAIVRRFGRVIDTGAGPGLHYRLPWPIDRVNVVATDSVRRTETPSSLMLTGDENLIAVRLSLHYTVQDPAAFLLNVADPEALVQEAGDVAMRQVVAGEQVDALLTVDKAEVQRQALVLAQQILDSYQTGIQVQGVQLLESDPPPEVADAFRDVASAREDLNTLVNEARAYQNEIVPLARGDADKAIQAASVYRSEKLAQARGEAGQFASRQGAYAESQDVTRIRLYLEAIEQVLPGARKFVLDSAVRLQTTDLWIPGASGAQSFPPQP